MHMQIFKVKKPLCKILKAKNCVPFEVQYYSTVVRQEMDIMHSDVMDTLFHSRDAWDSML